MSAQSSLLAADLAINIICSLVIAFFGLFLLTKLKIRLNLNNRIKWTIGLCAIVLRLGLIIDVYANDNFTPTATKYYLYWLLD